MRYIGDLREGDNVSEIYLCRVRQNLMTKSGKNYVSLQLQDKTGALDAKIWDLGSAIEHFEAMDYVHVDGQIVIFNSAPQLNVRRLRRAQAGEYDPADYMPMTSRDRREMFEEVRRHIATVSEPHLAALLKHFFADDKDFLKSFYDHSAAKTVHHSFMGGLLEHTLCVTDLCQFLAKQYPYLNHDLLITAALLHDIGKVRELSLFPANDYTDEGQLLGHIYMGTKMTEEAIAGIPGFPPELASELLHCILAHHGELEYGSPKKPAIAEAVALNMADNTDARLELMKETLAAADPKAAWLGFNRFFDSNIRRTE